MNWATYTSEMRALFFTKDSVVKPHNEAIFSKYAFFDFDKLPSSDKAFSEALCYALSSSAFGSQAINSYPVEILILIQVSYCAYGWTCTYYNLKKNLKRKSMHHTLYLSSLLIWSPKPTVSTTVSFSFTLLSFKSTKGKWQKTIIGTRYLIKRFYHKCTNRMKVYTIHIPCECKWISGTYVQISLLLTL